MENASKALIIAGAILLSILIISLGIMVYQNAKNTVGNANLNKQEIETFNSQWETYEGQNKTASEVKTMIRAVIASNAAEEKAGTNRFVAVENKGDANKANKKTTNPNSSISIPSATDLPNSGVYNISIGYGTDGLIVSIGWKSASSSGSGSGGTTP